MCSKVTEVTQVSANLSVILADLFFGSSAESVGGICCFAVVFVVESERSVDVKFIALGSIPK